MNQVIEKVENLKNSSVKDIIDKKMQEFSEFSFKDSDEIFKELCFCLLTANFSALRSVKIQKEINDGFLFLTEEELNQKLKNSGHRFPNVRAGFIIKARKHKNNLREILNEFSDEKKLRKWFTENIKGLGMKEASHFLRNIGYKNLAIIDFHIIDFLVKNNLIEHLKSRTLNPKKYLEIENFLEKIAEKTNLNLGELDLYLWYLETGKVLK